MLNLNEMIEKVLQDMRNNPATYYLNGKEVKHDPKREEFIRNINSFRASFFIDSNDKRK
jgi:hypothetical protein